MTTLLEQINNSKKESVKLSDVAFVIPGFAFKSKDFNDSGTALVKITEIQSPYVALDRCSYVDTSKYDSKKLQKYFLNEGEYVVAMTGATIGKVGKVITSEPLLLNQRVAVVRPKPDVYRQFVESKLTSPSFQSYINSIASGSSAQANISWDDIGDFEFVLPDYQIQKKIAEILNAYDTKIENNNLIIKKLEDTALAIFGESSGQFVEGKLADEAEIIMGQSPKSSHYNEDRNGLPFYQGVTYFGERFPENIIYSTGGDKRARLGDILVSVRAPVGRINISNSDMVIGRGLSALRSRSGHQSYLFYLLKNLFHKEDLFGSGSIFASINKKEFENLSINILTDEAKDKLESSLQPIDRMINERVEENIILKKMRDLLLAKLI